MKFDRADDTLLLKQIANGQHAAIEALYDRYNRLVFSVALTVVGDPLVAEEVTLDVFVHVWRGAKTYDPARAKPTTWLSAIARHHAIDVLRWQRSRLDTQSLYLDDMPWQPDNDLPDAEEQTELSMQRRRIRAAVNQLPNDQRQVLFLSYFKGYSHQQIADSLRQPLGTVKTRIRLAMQKLKHLLAGEQEPDASTSDATAYLTSRKD